jgi:hypothetical protein
MNAATLSFSILLPAFFFSLCFCPRADAISCPRGFITVGATSKEVLTKCGEPASSESWEDARPVGPLMYNSRYGFYTFTIYVPMETWVYNFGPAKFMQTLTFEKGRLIDIKSAGYGY